ncbi:MAG: hypothetical protein IKB04_04915 [Clostridia bacterium]|nr:hypothetical protein [Clostridia bacterium]
MVNIPLYSWFVSKMEGQPVTNVFRGSVGTDPTRGCLLKTTMNYLVYIRDFNTETARFVCECRVVRPWDEGSTVEEPVIADFPCSEEGRLEAEAWLNEQFRPILEQ